MNETSTTATTAPGNADLILALDLGKYKSVVCACDRASGEVRFSTIDTTRSELHKLLVRQRPGVVVIEACALCGWVYDLCAQFGVTCKVANTANEAWKFKHAKRKTDKDDALRLAQLEALASCRP